MTRCREAYILKTVFLPCLSKYLAMEKQNGLSRDTGRAFLWIETGRIEGEKGTFRSVGKYISQFREDYIVVLESKYCCFGKIIL